jgi:hypothetical protein
MIPATFVGSSDWGTSETLMLTDENFKNPNFIVILLSTDVFFEIRRL